MSNIQYHKFPRHESCTTTGCRSKYYYIEDGRKVCKSHGHVQEGFTQVAQDEDDFGKQGRTTRRKRQLLKKVEVRWTGKRGLGVYVEALQVVLRCQVRWLVEKGKVERRGEFEDVVRGLWAVRVRGVKGLGDENEEAFGSQGGFSSTSEGDTDVEKERVGERMDRRIKKVARDRGTPKLLETVVLCYLGCLLMRLPVSLGDFQMWIEREDFPYMGAVDLLPRNMRAHMPAEYIAALQPRAVLKRGKLQVKALQLIIVLKASFGIELPPVNASLIMFRHVKELCLPLEIYPCAFRLVKVLKLDFSYPDALRGEFRSITYPELRIMGLLVIATKLTQPFDDFYRRPEYATDPGTMKMEWEKWKQIMAKDQGEEKGLKKGEQIKVTEDDVFNMDDQKLDDYLDWYQKTWMDNKEDKLPKQILDLFPLEVRAEREVEPEAAPTSQDLKKIQNTLEVAQPIAEEQAQYAARAVMRPGMKYRRWTEASKLEDMERLFMEKAADRAGCSLDVLLKTVYQLEAKIERIIAKSKKAKIDLEMRE